MDEIQQRLISCFQAVLPDLSAAEIVKATQDNLERWDSVTSIMLVGVIEDEFHVQVDLEQLANLTSFDRLAQYIAAAGR